jgi:hypothetical protein
METTFAMLHRIGPRCDRSAAQAATANSKNAAKVWKVPTAAHHPSKMLRDE